ncbi:MAG: hypothetical protein RLZZ490_87 [Cyanobacteriota bacterium]
MKYIIISQVVSNLINLIKQVINQYILLKTTNEKTQNTPATFQR